MSTAHEHHVDVEQEHESRYLNYGQTKDGSEEGEICSWWLENCSTYSTHIKQLQFFKIQSLTQHVLLYSQTR